jgi:hypothetical protein
MMVDRVVHADWGSDPVKRWMCVAEWRSDAYRVLSPQPVGELESFLARVAVSSNGSTCLVGFDFPIGLPVADAHRAGIDSFRDMLGQFGQGDWADFYRLAERADEIAVRRPFYPRRPGGTRQVQLLRGLGVASREDLLRRCERQTAQRAAAAPLFWTLGAKQAGRAAIIGWRDLIAPGLAESGGGLSLWPFDGDLGTLLNAGQIVVCETYPAEACVQLGLRPPGRGWSKRSQVGRRAQAPALLDWVARRNLQLDADLRASVSDGFGASPGGEDPFDALLGLLAMLGVVLGSRTAGAPDDAAVRRLEGWILGLQS